MKIKHYCRNKINTVIETIVPFLLSALGKHILTSKNHYQQLMNFTSIWHEVLFPYKVFLGGCHSSRIKDHCIHFLSCLFSLSDEKWC